MDPRLLLIFLSGLIGGIGAYFIGAPMPFMLGGIVGAAAFVVWYERDGGSLPKLSRWVRLVFMSFIGAMIGSQFSPDLLTLLPQFWVSALCLIPFILIAHGGSYAIMTRLGKYEKRDAFFAALPGGIVDSTALAEEAGADLRVVTTQHFIRIILVVCSVPFLFLLIQGEAVGSLAGESIAAADYALKDVALLGTIAVGGLIVGRWLRLPVSHMLGPLLIAIALSVGDIVEINSPAWLVHLAQYMVGTALGAQFSGVSHKMLSRGLSMGLLAGCYMLVLAAIFATILVDRVPAEFSALFVSFAAGGLAEMSLIALSLNFNPVVVALHHLARILLTVWFASTFYKRLLKLEAGP